MGMISRIGIDIIVAAKVVRGTAGREPGPDCDADIDSRRTANPAPTADL